MVISGFAISATSGWPFPLKYSLNGNGQPDVAEIANPENTISSIVEKQSSYQDLKYSVSDLPEFSTFAIKIVLKGVDPAFVPKIQDIRAVASF